MTELATRRRLKIVHTTGFRYANDVVMSYNEARMTPLTGPGQSTLDAKVEVHPSVATYSYRDYWGTSVSAFEVRDPHARMEVRATSVVVTSPVTSSTDARLAWSDLGAPEVLDRFAELLAPTTRCDVDDEVLESARTVVGSDEPAQAGRAVAEWLADSVDYVKGATGVHTSAMEAWQVRKGVCQDFAHIATGVLRRLGIPARYVSGYLLPVSDAAEQDQVSGESHAWIEWWSGQWHAWDPTNGRPAGADHVVVARARDYDDVTPLKGIYSGRGGGELFVSVQFTQLG